MSEFLSKGYSSSSKLLDLEIRLKNQRGLLLYLQEEEERIRLAKKTCLSTILSVRRSILELEKNEP